MQILNQYGAPLSRDQLTVEDVFLDDSQLEGNASMIDADPEQIVLAAEAAQQSTTA